MSPTAQDVLKAVKKTAIPYTLTNGWDDPANKAHGTWAPSYVIEHHTANGGTPGNNPSLNWCVTGSFPPVRNCHFLIGRDGHIFVVYALKCYHAGKGGPGRWGNGGYVEQDCMNGYAYGIEIESKGTSLSLDGNNGYTAAQQASAAKLSAALLDMLTRTTECAINHRTWAPTRKVDTLLDDKIWHNLIASYRGGEKPKPSPQEIDMLLIRRAGTSSVYLLTGNQITLLATGDDYRALLLAGVKEANLSQATVDALVAGKD